jgi:outer membrane protein TolC
LPLSFLDEKEDDFDLEESFQVMAEEKAFKAAQLNTQQVQQEERSDVSLGVSLGRREGDVNIGSVVTDYQEESAQIFIEMDWPVVDKSRDAMRAKARILERKAELNHRQTKREILEKVHELRTNRRELLKQIDMAYDKIEISQKQVKRAMGLIKTGKIEFEDFARFRKGLLQARISTVELRQQLVKEQAQLSMLGPSLLHRCKELL